LSSGSVALSSGLRSASFENNSAAITDPDGQEWLLFVAEDFTKNYGRELYISNGTAAGTGLVADINRGAADVGLRIIGALGGDVYVYAGSSQSVLRVTVGGVADISLPIELTYQVTEGRPTNALLNYVGLGAQTGYRVAEPINVVFSVASLNTTHSLLTKRGSGRSTV
jgi:ELWxxDGT repeat protein